VGAGHKPVDFFFGGGCKISCLNPKSQTVMYHALPVLRRTYLTNEEFMHGFIPLMCKAHLHNIHIFTWDWTLSDCEQHSPVGCGAVQSGRYSQTIRGNAMPTSAG
jgi:hypothetical protein